MSCQLSPKTANSDWELDNWMSVLNDTIRLCKLSIPGTHDALSGCGFTDPKYIDDYTTQIATLDEQLVGGLRYFDVRLVLCGDSDNVVLQTSHRTATINLTFVEVLDKLSNYLSAHSSETVIMKIQYDGGDMDENIKEQWSKAMQSTLHDAKYKDLFADFRPDIRLKDARGKVLLISKTEYGEPVCGALTSWMDEGTEEYTHIDSIAERTLILSPNIEKSNARKVDINDLTTRLYVQDFYNTIGERINEKLHAVEAMYKSAIEVPDDANVWIINHTSGFSSPKMNAIGYAENASRTNAKLLSLLEADTTNRGIGIIPMDYACIDTLNQVIGTLGLINRSVMSKSLTRAIIEKNMK